MWQMRERYLENEGLQICCILDVQQLLFLAKLHRLRCRPSWLTWNQKTHLKVNGLTVTGSRILIMVKKTEPKRIDKSMKSNNPSLPKLLISNPWWDSASNAFQLGRCEFQLEIELVWSEELGIPGNQSGKWRKIMRWIQIILMPFNICRANLKKK